MPKLGMEPIRKAQLMAAAFECIHEYGFPGTMIAQVSEKAGLSVGITSHRFGSTEWLLDAKLTRRTEARGTIFIPGMRVGVPDSVSRHLLKLVVSAHQPGRTSPPGVPAY